MKLDEIKYQMIRFRDFYGQDLLGFDSVLKAKSKKELKKILDEHYVFLENQAIDARNSFDNWRKKVVEI